MRKFILIYVLLAAPGNSLLWADPTDTSGPPTSEISTPSEAPATAPALAPAMTPDQLDTLVAPIALYPDVLLSQILVASTYPLEIVQARQWLDQHLDLKGAALTQAAAQQNWDPSIQALVAFPDVLKRLNEDVTWTTNLGNSFLASQGNVMDAVQRMRLKAEQAGKLNSTPQEKVTTTVQASQKVIEIEPVNPQVIYVPEYDPVWIWGPPVYYYYPIWYYHPRPAGVWFWWGSGVYCGSYYSGWGGWGGWGWHPHWYNHTVIVNNTFIRQNNFNVTHVSNTRNITNTGNTVWNHDAYHRQGVSYPNRSLAAHYNPVARASFSPRPTPVQVQQQFHQSAIRVQSQPSGDRMGNRQIGSGTYNRNRSVYGGMEQGSSARMHSNRGYSSLGQYRNNRQGGGGHSFGGGRNAQVNQAPSSGGGHAGNGGGNGNGNGWGGGGHR